MKKSIAGRYATRFYLYTVRLFTLIVSALFVVIGLWMIADGKSTGWWVAGFFAFCLLTAVFEPWLPKQQAFTDFRLRITPEEIACEHPKRKRESIRWEDVKRIWYVTTSQGPDLPDEWFLLEGENGGCSFPTEAIGMDGFWEELKNEFSGFDYKPVIDGGTEDAKHLCWERPASTS